MKKLITLATLALVGFASGNANAKCEGLPSQADLKKALVEARKADNGGFNLDMWGSVVDRSGTVCAVAYTGEKVDSQWPGSRLISAQKAYTANSFSLAGLALATANLYSATQPGGSLYGLQHSNPIQTGVAYKGNAKDFGSVRDPLVGQRLGGINVFGGGLALYNKKGELVGAVGVSGDSSCADHNIAWRTRNSLKLDYVKAGVAPTKNDQIIYDVKDGKSAGGFGHVACGGKEEQIVAKLPATSKVEEVVAKVEAK